MLVREGWTEEGRRERDNGRMQGEGGKVRMCGTVKDERRKKEPRTGMPITNKTKQIMSNTFI